MSAAQYAVLTYAILSRMAYVLYVGYVLRREEREGFYVQRFGPVLGFRRFRQRASLVMYNDALSFILLCFVTRNTWALPVSQVTSIATGAVLAIVGGGTKLWAARTLGSEAYYWHNFFNPEEAVGPVSSGPYRFISSPMYTIGYLQTYGLALMVRSLPGLIIAALGQAAILAFYFVVEKPHFKRLHRSS
jgi:protein-S-isoprenylcysteine O-methyltransferase Ste14